MKVSTSSFRSAVTWVWLMAAMALVVLLLVGLSSVVPLRGQGPPCRVNGFPNIFCQEFTVNWNECTNFANCRPKFPICSPFPTPCTALGGLVFPRTKTLRAWELGTCTPLDYHTCLVCGNGCAYICAWEQLGSGTDPKSGDCVQPVCPQPEPFWAAPGQCSR